MALKRITSQTIDRVLSIYESQIGSKTRHWGTDHLEYMAPELASTFWNDDDNNRSLFDSIIYAIPSKFYCIQNELITYADDILRSLNIL